MGGIKVSKISGNVLVKSNDIICIKDIIESDNERRIIVIGAPGKTDKEEKVAAVLVQSAEYFLKTKKINQGLFEKIRQRFTDIFKPLKISDDSLNKCFDNLRGDC